MAGRNAPEEKNMAVKGAHSLEYLHAVIDRGEGVIYDGEVITDKHKLPSIADMAAGDPDAVASALQKLNDQQAILQAQIMQLQGGVPPPDSTGGTEPPVDTELGPDGKPKKPAPASGGGGATA